MNKMNYNTLIILRGKQILNPLVQLTVLYGLQELIEVWLF